MKNLFISWSGSRSQMMAAALKEWLPLVIQSIDPWLSAADLDKGKRWIEQLSDQLQQQRIGIICLTSDNLNAPWLFFEAGALSKSIRESFVCPYLLDNQPTDLQPSPFTQFDMTMANEEDTRALLVTINKALGKKGISEKVLDKQFEKWWPELEKKLASIPKAEEKNATSRSDRDLLEELLQITRSLARKTDSAASIAQLRGDQMRQLLVMEHLRAKLVNVKKPRQKPSPEIAKKD